VRAIPWDELTQAAQAVRKRAYAPYSNYQVGAALLAEDGRVFVGANVENASYGLAQCAERSAIGAAIAAGVRRFVAAVVASPGERPATPCGMCRQVLAEFPPSFPVRCVAEGEARVETTVAALLPGAFGAGELAQVRAPSSPGRVRAPSARAPRRSSD
jgi:cytidine deaminase